MLSYQVKCKRCETEFDYAFNHEGEEDYNKLVKYAQQRAQAPFLNWCSVCELQTFQDVVSIKQE